MVEGFRRLKRRTRDLPELPGYRIVEVLGQGGMGVVYRAWHEKLNREVAIKVINTYYWSDESARSRFETEARAIARLNHPNIVQIYEVGEFDERLFFSLEYCRGGSLSGWLNGAPLAAKPAAQLTRSICLAVHHAHERRIVHRDLKPANVVLQFAHESNFDRDAATLHLATPKVTDFGLARTAEENGQTRADAVIGTPSYMSPEQARGVSEITERSDIYSLGAILYELLTGRPPFKGSSVMETVRQVLNDDPVDPSQFNPNMPRDLETICLKALYKEPSRRYGTAAEFAEDLQRFLAGEPVRARPISAAQRVYRWSRRNPAWSTAIASCLLLMIVAWQLTWRNIVQTRTSLKELQIEQSKTLEEQKRTLAEQARTKEALAKANKSLYLANIAQSENAWSALSMVSMNEFLAQCPAEYRQWEWHFLNGLGNRRFESWQREQGLISSLAWQPEKQRIASANDKGEITVYDLTTSKVIFKRTLSATMRLRLGFLSEGRQLVFIEGSETGIALGAKQSRIGVINTEDPNAAPFSWTPSDQFGISDLAVCPKLNQFAVALLPAGRSKTPGVVKLFDAAVFPPKEISEFEMPAPYCRSIAISPQGDKIAIAGGERMVYLVDPATRQQIAAFEAFAVQGESGRAAVSNVALFGKSMQMIEWGVYRMAFSPDGQMLVAGLLNGQLRVWNTATKKLLHVLKIEEDPVLEIAVSGDNRRLAMSSANSNVINLFDLELGRKLAEHQGHEGRISGIHFGVDRDLMTSSFDRTIRIWGANDRSSSHTLAGHSRSAFAAAFHPNKKILATGDGNLFRESDRGSIRFWDIESRKTIRQLEVKAGGIGCLQFDNQGNRLAAACGDANIRIWHQQDEDPQILKGHFFSARSLAWRPGHDELASVSGSLAMTFLPGEAVIWDTQKMSKRLDLKGHTAALSTVVFSPDGRIVATGSADKTVRVWDADSGECLKTLSGPKDAVISLVFDPKGEWIAAGSGDIWNPIRPKPGEIHVWNVSTGEVVRVLRGHTQMVNGLAVTPDGRRLASCSRNDKVRIWEPSTGIEILTLIPADYACGVHFSPNGRKLIVPNWSGMVDVFSADTYGERTSK